MPDQRRIFSYQSSTDTLEKSSPNLSVDAVNTRILFKCFYGPTSRIVEHDLAVRFSDLRDGLREELLKHDRPFLIEYLDADGDRVSLDTQDRLDAAVEMTIQLCRGTVYLFFEDLVTVKKAEMEAEKSKSAASLHEKKRVETPPAPPRQAQQAPIAPPPAVQVPQPARTTPPQVTATPAAPPPLPAPFQDTADEFLDSEIEDGVQTVSETEAEAPRKTRRRQKPSVSFSKELLKAPTKKLRIKKRELGKKEKFTPAAGMDPTTVGALLAQRRQHQGAQLKDVPDRAQRIADILSAVEDGRSKRKSSKYIPIKNIPVFKKSEQKLHAPAALPPPRVAKAPKQETRAPVSKTWTPRKTYTFPRVVRSRNPTVESEGSNVICETTDSENYELVSADEDAQAEEETVSANQENQTARARIETATQTDDEDNNDQDREEKKDVLPELPRRFSRLLPPLLTTPRTRTSSALKYGIFRKKKSASPRSLKSRQHGDKSALNITWVPQAPVVLHENNIIAPSIPPVTEVMVMSEHDPLNQHRAPDKSYIVIPDGYVLQIGDFIVPTAAGLSYVAAAQTQQLI